MIDIPIGKALVAVENPTCNGCFFGKGILLIRKCKSSCRDINCSSEDRQDGKNVIFKLVDLREEYNHGCADSHAACSSKEES